MTTVEVKLRAVAESDLPIFFTHQLDPEANYMAGFVATDPTDRAAFEAHWAKIQADETVTLRTIVAGGGLRHSCASQPAGYIAGFIRFGLPEVGYSLGKEYWGQGIATASLRQFLTEMTVRPLYARAVKDNVASLRVLEKCGFVIAGYERAFANGRGAEVEEAILRLDD